MSPRPRHPAKSVVMFLGVVAICYVVYLNRDRLNAAGDAPMPAAEEIELLTTAILDRYEHDECFVMMRTNLLWRVHERRYRLDIEVSDGCDRDARSLTADIARLINLRSGKSATVFAYDVTDREVARFIL